jgi:hypothetical protein
VPQDVGSGFRVDCGGLLCGTSASHRLIVDVSEAALYQRRA